MPGAGTPIGSTVTSGAGGWTDIEIQDAVKERRADILEHCKSLSEHLVEAKVEVFRKGKGLEGGEPEQHLEGDGQEGQLG